MHIIKDTKSNKKKIQKSIKKYGFFAEHNFFHYDYCETRYKKNIFISFNDDMGILASVTKSDVWYMFAEVLAPKEKRMELFLEFLENVIKKEKGKKLVVEVSKEFKEQLQERLLNSDFKICRTNFILYWPLFNMNKWDGKLKGKDWKKLRNIRNRIYNNHSIKIKEANNLPKENLKKLIDCWCSSRNGEDKIDKSYYKNIIDNDFKGFDVAKTVVIDNNPCSIYAGWRIPNSNNYYSAIGIANYEHNGIIDFSNLHELKEVKKKGYKRVDFGGSDKCLLVSKKKFKPESIYKTYTFSIKKK